MAELDDLHRLAPSVDRAPAGAAFRRRRRRSRSLRRGAWATAALSVLVVGTVAVIANTEDDAPVVAGPGGSEGPVTFDVLTVAQASDDMGTLRSATTEGEYVNLWKYANTSDPRPEVAFDEQVVVSITIPDDACPPTLVAFERAGEVLTPTFVDPTTVCVDPLIPKTFVVALDRAPLGAAFTLRLPADTTYDYGEQLLRIDLGGEGAIPTVWAQAPSDSQDGMAALVVGTVRYDADHGCFSLEQGELSYPVVWPAGTTGTAVGPGVVLPGGEVARVGDEVTGGGGYLQVADEYDIPTECLPDSGEVAVYNPNEHVTVISLQQGVDPPEPTCPEIERFAEQLIDIGIDYDLQPSASPEALAAEADLVLYGTLTGGFDVRSGDGPVSDHVGYEIDVQAVFKSPPGVNLTNPLKIWVAFGKYGPDGEPYRDAIAPGAPVVVFAYLDPAVGFTAAVEGFATGCPDGPPLGFLGSTGEWTQLESLDDLVIRLEESVASG